MLIRYKDRTKRFLHPAFESIKCFNSDDGVGADVICIITSACAADQIRLRISTKISVAEKYLETCCRKIFVNVFIGDTIASEQSLLLLMRPFQHFHPSLVKANMCQDLQNKKQF